MNHPIANRFFHLPNELIQYIYELDCTFKEIFDNTLEELKILYKNLNYLKDRYNLVERFNNLNDNMKNNKYLIKNAIKKNGTYYRFASDNLKHNLEIINLAIESNGLALEYVPIEIVENDDYYYLSEKAIKNEKLALKFCCGKMRNNKEKVLFCLKSFQSSTLYTCISNELKNDSEIIDICLNYNPNIYIELPEDVKEDLRIIHRILDMNPMLYNRIPEKYKTDKKILFSVLEKNYKMLQYFPEIIKNDNEILIKALQRNLNSLSYFSKRDEVINKEIISISIRRLKKDINNFKKFPQEQSEIPYL